MRADATKLCEKLNDIELRPTFIVLTLPFTPALVVPIEVARIPEMLAPNSPLYSPSFLSFSTTNENECVCVYACARPMVWSQNTLRPEKS